MAVDAHPLELSIAASFAAHGHIPQVAFGILVDGALARVGGVGGAAASTRFRIASMTKSFTAAALLTLHDEGALDLDVPIASIDPRLGALDEAAQRLSASAVPVTTRHLLTMSSGLATDDPWADRQMAADPAFLDGVLADGVTFAALPGTAFEYSNLGYAVVGRIAERVSGMRLQELVTTRLIEPLGLASTGWDVPPDSVDWARPHRWQDGEIIADLPPVADGSFAPLGGLWSTVEDLAVWVAFLSDPSSPGPLSGEARRVMSAVAVAERPDPYDPTDPFAWYGMGLETNPDRSAGLASSHSGGLPGYGSHMCWTQDRRLGVITLGNVTYAPARPMAWAILRGAALVDGSGRGLNRPIGRLGARLVALLNNWDTAMAAVLFTDNVELDEDLERRARGARELVDKHGLLQLVGVEPDRFTRGVLTVLGSGSGALLRISVKCSPHADSKVQWYKVDSWT